MSKLSIDESTLVAIGDAIREKTEGSDKIAPLDMPAAIREIKGGEEYPRAEEVSW